MKKIKMYFGIVFLLALGLVSCSTEENAIADTTVRSVPESARTPEILAFQNALVMQLKERNSETGKNTQNGMRTMNESEALIDAASTFLAANGLPQADRKSESNAVILSKALKMLAEKTKMTANN